MLISWVLRKSIKHSTNLSKKRDKYDKDNLKAVFGLLELLVYVMSLIRTTFLERSIRAHAQSVLAAGQKHHNSSPLASACNMVTNKDLKR